GLSSSSTPSPYTTLFRSDADRQLGLELLEADGERQARRAGAHGYDVVLHYVTLGHGGGLRTLRCGLSPVCPGRGNPAHSARYRRKPACPPAPTNCARPRFTSCCTRWPAARSAARR